MKKTTLLIISFLLNPLIFCAAPEYDPTKDPHLHCTEHWFTHDADDHLIFHVKGFMLPHTTQLVVPCKACPYPVQGERVLCNRTTGELYLDRGSVLISPFLVMSKQQFMETQNPTASEHHSAQGPQG